MGGCACYHYVALAGWFCSGFYGGVTGMSPWRAGFADTCIVELPVCRPDGLVFWMGGCVCYQYVALTGWICGWMVVLVTGMSP